MSTSFQTIAWFCCFGFPILLIGCVSEYTEPASGFSSAASADEKQSENEQQPISDKDNFSPAPDFSNVPIVPVSSVMRVPVREDEKRYHEVASGETLSLIAKKYSVSVNRLCKTNLLNRSAVIVPKQLLIIPKSR